MDVRRGQEATYEQCAKGLWDIDTGHVMFRRSEDGDILLESFKVIYVPEIA